MTHVTTLLIVMALTGGPVANATCASWCESRPTMGNCGEYIAESISATISGGGDTCPALLADSPFLREEGLIAAHTPTFLGVFHAPDASLTGGGRMTRIRDNGGPIDGRLAPALVLRV